MINEIKNENFNLLQSLILRIKYGFIDAGATKE